MPTLSSENSKNKNTKKAIHTILSNELFNILVDLIEYNFNKTNKNTGERHILQCFDEKMLSPLGFYRTKIVELLENLFSYFKNISSLYDKLLIESQFFESAFIYLFEYEFNNLYQDALLSLLKTFLNYSDDHEILAEHLFNKMKLTDIIINGLNDVEIKDSDIISDKTKFKYEKGNMTNHGYIAFLISLSYKLNTIVGGVPLKINGTISREGSMTFITRATPFVGKEEIDNFYGMDSNEIYEDVVEENEENKPKFNTPVKSMEKYLNDKWKEFFNENIAGQIKLYESKLYKEDSKNKKRTTLFHNPFVVEDSSEIRDEKLLRKEEKENGEEDEDILEKERQKLNKEPDFEKMLYEENGDNNVDADMDINMNNNIFKMSMINAFKNNNTLEKEQVKKEDNQKIRESKIIGSKTRLSRARGSVPKICVDEVDLIDEFNDNNL